MYGVMPELPSRLLASKASGHPGVPLDERLDAFGRQRFWRERKFLVCLNINKEAWRETIEEYKL